MRFAAAVLLAATSLATPGCTWVPLTGAGRTVGIRQPGATEDCQRIGRVSAQSRERVFIFARSERTVREELESLARNEAADMGGNAIVPVGAATEGRQSFDVYRCEAP